MDKTAFVVGFVKAAQLAGVTEQQALELLKTSGWRDMLSRAGKSVSDMGPGARVGAGTALGAAAGYGAHGAMDRLQAPTAEPSWLDQLAEAYATGKQNVSQWAEDGKEQLGKVTGEYPYAAPVGLGALGLGAGAAMGKDKEDALLKSLLGGSVGAGTGLGLNYLMNRKQ